MFSDRVIALLITILLLSMHLFQSINQHHLPHKLYFTDLTAVILKLIVITKVKLIQQNKKFIEILVKSSVIKNNELSFNEYGWKRIK